MAVKSKTVYICSACGAQSLRWTGQCASCGEWNTLEEQTVRFGEYNIMMMHGHSRYVKHGISSAAAHAAASGADILLYGHTHERLDKYIPDGEELGGTVLKKPLRVFNPGSIGAPHDGRYSFGIITIRGRDVLTSHGEVNN